MLTALTRIDALGQLGAQTFDLAIIGAGINGASVARAACLRGYSVAVIEMDDIASGTSSRSSRLIHGGLRYLEHAEFGLVFESLAERALLARIARHLVRPLHFVLPIYAGDRVGMFQARVGLWLYDTLALFRNYKTHQALAPQAVATQLLGITTDKLKGAIGYYDYRTDDGRLVLENLLSADTAGAVVVSYAQVTKVDIAAGIGGLKQLTVCDRLSQRTTTVKARAVLCAAGPFTDEVLAVAPQAARTERWLRPTKGVHIVVPKERLAAQSAMVMQHPRDGRVLFVLPFFERTVIGTTDTDYTESAAQVATRLDDVDYLIDAASHYFPDNKLSRGDVIASWAGVRPLLHADSESTAAVSREHRIETRTDGLVIVAGGKLTTYRRIASEILGHVMKVIHEAGGPAPVKPHAEEQGPLPGAIGLDTEADFDALLAELVARTADRDIASHLAFTYGVRARELLALVDARAELGARVVPDLPIVWAQIVYAAKRELCITLTDVLIRRTQLVYRDLEQGLTIAPRAAELLGEVLGWDAAECTRQVADYRHEVERAYPGRSVFAGR